MKNRGSSRAEATDAFKQVHWSVLVRLSASHRYKRTSTTPTSLQLSSLCTRLPHPSHHDPIELLSLKAFVAVSAISTATMSSQASRNGERGFHQEYIARIRYSNALPPPPNPPKLLDIPNTGLASGQYTTPGFASRLARDQPLNIEADAELGMPLDLVGMPGVFDGDESCRSSRAFQAQ